MLKKIRPTELFELDLICGKCIYFKTEGCKIGPSVEYQSAPCGDGVILLSHKKIITLIRTFSLDKIKYVTIKKGRLTTKSFKNKLIEDFLLNSHEIEELLILVNKKLTTSPIEQKEYNEEKKDEKRIDPIIEKKAYELLKNPNIFDKFIEDSGRHIVMDELTRKIELLTCISAYGELPLNLAILGVWSSGKTKTITTVASYFDGVSSLFGMTPKALIYQKGEFDENSNTYTVDLRNQILIFLDEPHPQTLAMLKPLLSRDKYESVYKYVEKETLKTTTTILKGYPVCIFCAVSSKYTEEFTSRWLTASPETSRKKIREVIERKGEMAKEPEKYAEGELFQVFKTAFEILRDRAPHSVVIPYADSLSKCFSSKKPVDMRFFEIFLSLIRATTILHAFQREKNEDGKLIATLQDYEVAREVFTKFEKPTVYGIGENVLNFYENLLKTDEWWETAHTYDSLLEKYKEVYGEAISRTHMREEYLKPLERIGLIDIRQNPVDRRMKEIVPLLIKDKSLIDHEKFKNIVTENLEGIKK